MHPATINIFFNCWLDIARKTRAKFVTRQNRTTWATSRFIQHKISYLIVADFLMLSILGYCISSSSKVSYYRQDVISHLFLPFVAMLQQTCPCVCLSASLSRSCIVTKLWCMSPNGIHHSVIFFRTFRWVKTDRRKYDSMKVKRRAVSLRPVLVNFRQHSNWWTQ